MKQLALLLVASLLLFGCVSPEQQQSNAPVNSQANLTTQSSANASGGVSMQNTAQKGDNVAVDYVGSLDNGTVFDTSIKEEAEKAGLPLRDAYAPLEFTVGAGQMIKGFDAAVVGMKVGEEKTVHLAPADAYGEIDPQYIMTVPIANVPEGVKVGSRLSTQTGIPGVVTSVTDVNVTVDFNNPLAGKALNFRIIMRKITKA